MVFLLRPIAIVAILMLVSVGAVSAQTAIEAGQSIVVNGFEMYYEVHGQGEPLLLLHGFTGSSARWVPMISHLSKEYRLIIPDLRGHGRSTNPSKEFTHRQSALDVFALLNELEVEKFKGMGISTGGMTLLHMATSQPERVEAMVLIGATSYFPEDARQVMRERALENLNEEAWNRMRQRHHHGDEQIRMLFTQFHRFKDSYDDMNFTKAYLSTITANTLIVHGDRDRFFPVAIPVEMYDAIPQSYLWIVPYGSHVPIFGDWLASFVETTGQFLRGDWEKN